MVPLAPGRALPEFPPNGVQTEADVRRLPGVRVIDQAGLFPGASSSIYAFQQQLIRRNLYRVAIPR